MSKKELLKSSKDSAWKDILDVYIKECMEFFYPEISKKIDWSVGYEILDKELQSITTEAMIGKRFVDKLIKVKSIDGTEQVVLLHIEVQGQKEDEFSLRLFQYYYRLFDRYKKPILTLTILTDDNKSWNPENYQTKVWDFPVLSFNFQTCKLLNYQDNKEDLESVDNPFGIVVLAHLAATETKNDSKARYKIKFALIRRLLEKGYGRDYVINLYKMIDWVLVLPKELALEFKSKIHDLEEAKKVSYITSIEQLGREEGLKTGLEQGLRKGLEEGERRIAAIAKNLLAEGRSPGAVQKLTGLSEKEVIALVDKH